MVPVVFQALPKWDGSYNSTALTVSKLLSRNRKVFYVEHPFSYPDRLKAENQNQLAKRNGTEWAIPFADHPNFITIHPPLTLPLNSLPEGKFYKFLLKLYNRKLWKRIDSVLIKHGVPEFGYINSFDPVYFDIESELRCRYKVYHSVDLISGEPYIAKHGVKAEMNASRNSNEVLTTSYPLKERLSNYNPLTTCIPNAADFDHFSGSFPVPDEFKKSSKQKVVYTGNIGLRIDYELLYAVAKSFPDIEFWLVGPKDPNYFEGNKLEKLPNIYFTGSKSYITLPGYIHHADVCIIPFKCNELTHHIYPLKLNEYLSSGKPIVTSVFTDLTEFKDVLYEYNTADDAIQKLKDALGECDSNISEKRIRLASQNTWESRISDWEKVLYRLESKTFIDNKIDSSPLLTH